MRNIGRLTRALGLAARAGATERRLDVFITEYGILSKPKDFGVSLPSRPATWRSASTSPGATLTSAPTASTSCTMTRSSTSRLSPPAFAGRRAQEAELSLLPGHAAAQARGQARRPALGVRAGGQRPGPGRDPGKGQGQAAAPPAAAAHKPGRLLHVPPPLSRRAALVCPRPPRRPPGRGPAPQGVSAPVGRNPEPLARFYCPMSPHAQIAPPPRSGARCPPPCWRSSRWPCSLPAAPRPAPRRRSSTPRGS